MMNKEFFPYNDYNDRGFIKWQTAFVLGELGEEIERGQKEAYKDVQRLPQQDAEIIEAALLYAFYNQKEVQVQLNRLDEFGRQDYEISGKVGNFVTEDKFYIGKIQVHFDDIRYIKIK